MAKGRLIKCGLMAAGAAGPTPFMVQVRREGAFTFLDFKVDGSDVALPSFRLTRDANDELGEDLTNALNDDL